MLNKNNKLKIVFDNQKDSFVKRPNSEVSKNRQCVSAITGGGGGS